MTSDFEGSMGGESVVERKQANQTLLFQAKFSSEGSSGSSKVTFSSDGSSGSSMVKVAQNETFFAKTWWFFLLKSSFIICW